MSSVVVVGISHGSPACARIVADAVRRLRPSHVLVEGPADFNALAPDLTREHELPIAVLSHVRRGDDTRVTTTAFTHWSPEWVALRAAMSVGAQTHFIDLPTWHRDFETTAPQYGSTATSLMRRLGVETMSAAWDHVVESRAFSLPMAELAGVIDDYFDTIRPAENTVSARERFMTEWVRAARDRDGSGPVVVVCGGLHRPAILAGLATEEVTDGSWPEISVADADMDVGSYLVPFSYGRLRIDSPWWYETLWEAEDSAAEVALDAVVRDLRTRGHTVSTADFIACRTQLHALAAMRSHRTPTRIDVFEAVASTLVDEGLASPLPWTRSDRPQPSDHPVLASCSKTMRGRRFGSLHPHTPAPGLVHHVDLLLEELDLGPGTVALDLAAPPDRRRSRVLHQLRVAGIPGFDRRAGPGSGAEVSTSEQWSIAEGVDRLPSLVEAAAYGHTLVDVTGHVLESSLRAARFDVALIAATLFDAVLCGVDSVSNRSASQAVESIASSADLAGVGVMLRSVLDLWRHDVVLRSGGSALLGAVVDAASSRTVDLARRTRSAAGGADAGRIGALAALSDAMTYAADVVTENHAPELAALADDVHAAVDIRGAALGTVWSTTSAVAASATVRSVPTDRLGDWLCGLFAVAREEFLDAQSGGAVLGAVDDVVGNFTELEFLMALPALRQSFEYFPPRERARIALRITTPTSPVEISHGHEIVTAGAELDDRVDHALARVGL